MTEALPQLGVCYFPEHWPRKRWQQDARLMREAGLSVVRLGEFAWGRIEPEPGQFDWQWLDDAVAVLAKEGLKLILCTPTATPPKWLVDSMPDMIAIDVMAAHVVLDRGGIIALATPGIEHRPNGSPARWPSVMASTPPWSGGRPTMSMVATIPCKASHPLLARHFATGWRRVMGRSAR